MWTPLGPSQSVTLERGPYLVVLYTPEVSGTTHSVCITVSTLQYFNMYAVKQGRVSLYTH